MNKLDCFSAILKLVWESVRNGYWRCSCKLCYRHNVLDAICHRQDATASGFGSFYPSIDQDYYSPLLQIRIDGLRETCRVGEEFEFAVAQKEEWCLYPEVIMIKDLKGGVIVWEYNGTHASSLLFCPVVINSAEFEITWHSKTHV